MFVWNNAVTESVLGNMKISQIKQLHIRSFYSELVKRGLSANTVKLYHNLIYPALELAVDSDIIRRNPAKNCQKIIGGSKRQRTALTEAEQAIKERRKPELLPHISAHILRHTACTRLAESGLEPKVLQYIMGHANVSITLDVYTHLDFTQIQKKMEGVQKRYKISFFSKSKGINT